MSEDTFAEAFCAVMDYTEPRIDGPISTYEGCAEFQIDEKWWIALNGHREPTPCSKGQDVPPFHCLVYWRDVPAAIIHPYGGEFVAHPNANADLFIDDVRAAA